MPKKQFQYKQLGPDIWYTDSLKGWFIVKEKNQYLIKKGSIIGKDTVEFGTKVFKIYQRLGDSKVGLENLLKDRTINIKKQEELYNALQKENGPIKTKETKDPFFIDYAELDKEAERLKKKWGLR